VFRDSVPGSGIEILSNERNSNGQLATPNAENGSTAILEEDEILQMLPKEAGGVVGDAATNLGRAKGLITKIPNLLYNEGKAVSNGSDIIDFFDKNAPTNNGVVDTVTIGKTTFRRTHVIEENGTAVTTYSQLKTEDEEK